MSQRAALYLRVSTTRQADKDLSIPDQRGQGTAYCRAKDWPVVAEFVEAVRTGWTVSDDAGRACPLIRETPGSDRAEEGRNQEADGPTGGSDGGR
jgi:hypothetical protein